MKIPNDIKKRIVRQRKLGYGLDSQRAELLKRNKVFLQELGDIKAKLGDKFFELYSSNISIKELSKLSTDNFLLKRNWPPVKLEKLRDIYKDWPLPAERYERIHVERITYLKRGIEISESKDLESVLVADDIDIESEAAILNARLEVLRRYKELWQTFCNAWGIWHKWDGELSSLSTSMSPLLAVGADRFDPNFPIYIYINPSTKLDDIRKAWPFIKKFQNKFLYRMPTKSPNFGRDISWYDLNKEYGLSPGKIAKFWTENFPRDIDLLVIKQIMRESDEKDTLGKEDPACLLNEIMEDPAMADTKSRLEAERKLYIKGPYSQFIDLIKKTIKNMNEKISRSNKLSPPRPSSGHGEK